MGDYLVLRKFARDEQLHFNPMILLENVGFVFLIGHDIKYRPRLFGESLGSLIVTSWWLENAVQTSLLYGKIGLISLIGLIGLMGLKTIVHPNL